MGFLSYHKTVKRRFTSSIDQEFDIEVHVCVLSSIALNGNSYSFPILTSKKIIFASFALNFD